MKKAELLAEQSRLLALANELSRKHWGVDYTGTFELVNRHWRSQFGQFHHTRDKSVQHIRMSAATNAERTPEEVEQTLTHELVHWRLFTLDQPFRDYNDEFITECIRVGASISKARIAQEAYQRYMYKREFEELTGQKYV